MIGSGFLPCFAVVIRVVSAHNERVESQPKERRKTAMETLIEMRNIRKGYTVGGQHLHALDGVDFAVKQGETVAILGPSGSGKSTLMNLLGCLDTPDEGEYRLAGNAVERMSEGQLARIRSETVGFVFQGFHLLPGLTALENVELPLLYRGFPEHTRRRLAQERLEQVGLSARMGHRPAQLSGGQQQRVAIARAMVGKPPVLLADEPTGNLDTAAGAEIMTLLRRLGEAGHTVIIITHDPAIGKACPRRVVMRDGRLHEG